MEHAALKSLQEYHLQLLIQKLQDKFVSKGIQPEEITTFQDVLSHLHLLISVVDTDNGYQATYLDKETKMLLVRFIDPLCKIMPQIIWDEKDPNTFEVFVHFRYSWMDEDFVIGYDRATFNPHNDAETMNDFVKKIRGGAISSTLSEVLGIGMRDKADILSMIYEEEREKEIEDKIKKNEKHENTKDSEKARAIDSIDSLPTGPIKTQKNKKGLSVDQLLFESMSDKTNSVKEEENENNEMTMEYAMSLVPDVSPQELKGLTLGEIFKIQPQKLIKINDFTKNEPVKKAISLLVAGTMYEKLLN